MDRAGDSWRGPFGARPVIYLLIACRILYLMTLGRNCSPPAVRGRLRARGMGDAWLMTQRRPSPTLGTMIRLMGGFEGS